MNKGEEAGWKEPTDDNECKTFFFKGKPCAHWWYPDPNKITCLAG